MASLSIGAFYNPHLGAELVRAGGIDHLAMADPPAAGDPHWPAIRARYTLLLHDYLGQLSEPLDERSIERARTLAELYRTPWVAEHFQCLHTVDGTYNLNYVFPPLYTEDFLDRFVRNATALKARLNQPLVMENIPGFFDVRASQLPEPVWLRRFFEATETGFLLDLPHVWLEAHYRGMKPERWLAEFPLVRGVAHSRPRRPRSRRAVRALPRAALLPRTRRPLLQVLPGPHPGHGSEARSGPHAPGLRGPDAVDRARQPADGAGRGAARRHPCGRRRGRDPVSRRPATVRGGDDGRRSGSPDLEGGSGEQGRRRGEWRVVRAGNGGGDGPPGARLRSTGRAAAAVAPVERGTAGAGTVHRTARGPLSARTRSGRAQHGGGRGPPPARRRAQDSVRVGQRRGARGP